MAKALAIMQHNSYFHAQHLMAAALFAHAIIFEKGYRTK
jgi:hypothetical protein